MERQLSREKNLDELPRGEARATDVVASFLKATKNPLIFLIDDVLEDVREFVENVTVDPKETLFALREKIDSRIDLDIGCPPDLQRGFVAGALVGVVGGL